MRRLTIGDRIITDNDVFIIAEIGSNHGGDPALCEKMIIEAAKCGVDAVKLQKRDNLAMFTKEALIKPYENENSYGKTYGEHRQHLDWFGRAEFTRFKAIADKMGVLFFATPFEEASVDFLAAIGVPLWKIASCDATNYPLIKQVAAYGQPVIISTGGASYKDIIDLIDYIEPINSNFALLHCVSTYPNRDEELNLRFIEGLRSLLPDNIIGFSSHHSGVDAMKDAIKCGARILEVHFTLNRSWKGIDNSFSLEPKGLQEICEYPKRYFTRLGNGEKVVLPAEKEGFVKKMGKSIYLKTPLEQGEVITRENIIIKSPAGGLRPDEVDRIVGKVILNDLSTGVPVKEGDFK